MFKPVDGFNRAAHLARLVTSEVQLLAEGAVPRFNRAAHLARLVTRTGAAGAGRTGAAGGFNRAAHLARLVTAPCTRPIRLRLPCFNRAAHLARLVTSIADSAAWYSSLRFQ